MGTERQQRERAPTTPDPIEIAMEAEASGEAPAGEARALLADQRRLIRAEILQRRGLFAAFAVAAVMVLGGLATMVWSASRADGLVIDTFSVPADLAQAGATGEAVASQLKDKLNRMSEETITPQTATRAQDALTSDVKVEIAGTGVSLDELNRVLRSWLGREAHVTGEVARVTSGPDTGALAISVRLPAQPGERLVQADGNLDALIGRAAERVYAARSPFPHAAWLEQQGRLDEAKAALERLSRTGEARSRATALYMLSRPEFLGAADRRPLLREALRIDPQLPPVLTDLGAVAANHGQMEAALGYYRRLATARLPKEISADGRRFNDTLATSLLGATLGDYAAGIGITCLAYGVSPCTDAAMTEAGVSGAMLSRADPGGANRLSNGVRMLVLRHDLSAARRILAAQTNMASNWAYARANDARGREDWPAVLALAAAWRADEAKGLVGHSEASPTLYEPLALAKLGRMEEAERLAAAWPADCVLCLRVRGQVAAERRDWAAADRWFRDAVRLAPSYPLPEAEWAQALLARGQPEAALAHAQSAARKGPKFADAYQAWGEALLATGDAKGAAAKLANAAAITPRWGRAHLKWGEALAKLGKAKEAQAQWRAAAGMDLTAAERAELVMVSK